MDEVILKTTNRCFLTTPSHLQRFLGKINIFRSAGELQLTNSHLRFREERGVLLNIPLDAISDITDGQYSRWAKPRGLNYIGITYQIGGARGTVILTPTKAGLPDQGTNKEVVEWEEAIRSAWKIMVAEEQA